MKTAGYDLVTEVKEDFVNRFLTIAYCSGKLPKRKLGSYQLPIPNIPDTLKEFTTVGYRIDIGLPVLDFFNVNKARIRLSGTAYFKVLGGIEFKIDGFFSFDGTAAYNQSTRQISLDFSNPNLNIEFCDQPLPLNVMNRLNEIIKIAMQEYLTKDVTTISVTPVLYSQKLPLCNGDLTVGLGNIKSVNEILAAAFNFQGYNGGNIANLNTFVGNSDLGVGISENAMHRVYDFWWNNTTVQKSYSKEKEKSFDTSSYDNYVDWLLAAIAAVVPGLGSILAAVASAAIDINKVQGKVGAGITFNKPNFNLLDNKRIEICGNMDMNIWAKLFLEIKVNFLIGSKTWDKEIASYSNNFSVSYSAKGSVNLNSDNCLVADIEDIDLQFNGLLSGAPEFLLNDTINWLVDRILDELPPVVLSPVLITKEIPELGTKLGVNVNNIDINNEEAIVCANATLEGLSQQNNSLFIANCNPNSMEVHRAECEWAKKISSHNKVPYMFLDEAHRDGYDDCAFCLPNSTR